MGKNLHSHYGRGVSGSNLIVHGIVEREITTPDICLLPLFFFFFSQTFYAPYEIPSVTSAIFSLLKVSYFIQLLGYQSVCAWYPAFPEPHLSFAFAPVDVAVPAVGHLCCSLAICEVIGNG